MAQYKLTIDEEVLHGLFQGDQGVVKGHCVGPEKCAIKSWWCLLRSSLLRSAQSLGDQPATHPVTVPTQRNDVSMAQQAVEDNRSRAGTGKLSSPATEIEVARHDERDVFVRLADELKQLVGSDLAQTEIAHLIQDDQVIMVLPDKYRRRLRRTNTLERLDREVRRTERVIGIFPNVDSASRLLGAYLTELDEDSRPDESTSTWPTTGSGKPHPSKLEPRRRTDNGLEDDFTHDFGLDPWLSPPP